MARCKKILVANRGEIALRVVRACRELGIPSVAVYSEADRTALHVRAATEACCLGSPEPSASYLRPEKILAAARAHGADAIHPGYGFLSENAGFAEAVQEAGLVWIGPPAEAIRRMGDKVQARRTMQQAGVPVVPGTLEEAQDPGALVQAAAGVGYPLLIKAAGGGGGKGIRVVQDESELVNAWERARSEAATGFGNAAVYLERYLTRARHVEIQVFADQAGHTVHLGERDCSMQRRHQKIIEEAPSPAVDAALRARMGEAAVQAARAVGYVNAGTVEFLLADTGEFFFLEMNTRLQVEHPVTESVTGIDLVREQILVAGGEDLSFTQDEVTFSGHSIEARICSEQPERGFLPATGRVESLEVPGGAQVRFDSSLYPGLVVGVHYDPMLAKLIVTARDRDSAIRRLRRALEELKVTGLSTNASFLWALAGSDRFRSGDYHTGTVEQELDTLLPRPARTELWEAAVLAAALHRERQQQRSLEPPDSARTAWRQAGWQRTAGRWHA